ncbi:DHA2 family efflux MFS transporter permease subunit [Streptomyces sp. NPDC059525]|uniref:DHA2 family efflux MFS transporter permease subunit n=1 Tax=Streptomyces sp. NPDC059525 TaxID=3346857 RepID=UPI0036972DD1
MSSTPARPSFGTVILAVSLPMFMVALDNLMVTNALTSIRADLGASVEDLQWITNAYILGFAGLLLAAAALGDRFGRKRVFVTGIVVFALTSVGGALSSSTEALVLFRALQGMSAAAVMPLSLTLLAMAVPAEKRGAAIGLWSGISGLAVALSPLIGGAITSGLDWQWIFWVNVPVAVVAVPLVLKSVSESRGAPVKLDLLGLVLACAGVVSLVWAIVNGHEKGWGSAPVVSAFAAAVVLLGAFIAWERKAAAPLLPLSFYRVRAFTLSNVVSLAVYFGMFGATFLIAQYLQTGLGHSAFVAGLWTLPWAVMPMFIAPQAGKLAAKVGAGRLMALGLAVSGVGLAWFALVVGVGISDWAFVGPFVLAGAGMGLVFAPTATVVMGAVPPQHMGKASGANTTVRELGGALGIAVLASVFAAQGDFSGQQRFVDGLVPAVWIAVAVVFVGALFALAIPRPKAAPAPAAAPATPAVPAKQPADATA